MFVGGPVNGSGSVIIMAGQKYRHRKIDIICVGNKRHYRKDGSCAHTDQFIDSMLPEFKPKARVVPFGGKAENGTVPT
jgi:hypothetical protein